MSRAAEIFSSKLTTDAKVDELQNEDGGEGYLRSLLRTYPDMPMPEPGLTLVAKEEGKDVYLYKREGTSEGFLVLPETHAMKGPLPLAELEELDVWEPGPEEDEDQILQSAISS